MSIIEKRCDCGKLLFKRVKHGIEFKCTRCKRVHLIPFGEEDQDFHNICPVVDINEEKSENS